MMDLLEWHFGILIDMAIEFLEMKKTLDHTWGAFSAEVTLCSLEFSKWT